MTAIVISFRAARLRRVETLAEEAAERARAARDAYRRFGKASWQRKVRQAELDAALHRLSLAQGMRP